jgi:hypothetical protein
MKDLPWGEIINLLRFFGYILLAKWVLEFCKFLIRETCGRYCKHCEKKI